jgi:hypothetical protein
LVISNLFHPPITLSNHSTFFFKSFNFLLVQSLFVDIFLLFEAAWQTVFPFLPTVDPKMTLSHPIDRILTAKILADYESSMDMPIGKYIQQEISKMKKYPKSLQSLLKFPSEITKFRFVTIEELITVFSSQVEGIGFDFGTKSPLFISYQEIQHHFLQSLNPYLSQNVQDWTIAAIASTTQIRQLTHHFPDSAADVPVQITLLPTTVQHVSSSSQEQSMEFYKCPRPMLAIFHYMLAEMLESTVLQHNSAQPMLPIKPKKHNAILPLHMQHDEITTQQNAFKIRPPENSELLSRSIIVHPIETEIEVLPEITQRKNLLAQTFYSSVFIMRSSPMQEGYLFSNQFIKIFPHPLIT